MNNSSVNYPVHLSIKCTC